MCINYFFEKKYGITKPINTQEMDNVELTSLLVSEFLITNIDMSDMKYKTAPFTEYERFLIYDDTDKILYIPEFFDCDDFSVRLHGNITIPYWSALVFGELWVKLSPTKGHAVNFFVDNQHRVWIVEPQNDKIFIMPDDWEAYRIEV